MDAPHDVEVILELPLWVESAHDVDFGELFVELSQDLVHGHLVRVIVTWLRGEVAKRAVEHAKNRGVDLPVHHEIHDVTVLPALHVIGHFPDRRQIPALQHGEAVAP